MSDNLIEHIGLLIATILSGVVVIYFRRQEAKIDPDESKGKSDASTDALSPAEYEKIISDLHNQIQTHTTDRERD